jgi:SAP domain
MAAQEDYESQNVEDLKEELRTRDLPVSGTKEELVARLKEDDDSEDDSEVKPEQINLDDELAKPQSESGITPDDLVGGKPADPDGLKVKLAKLRSEANKSNVATVDDPEAGVVGEAGPAGPQGPVLDRFGAGATGGGMIAELSPEEAKELRAPEEAINAKREARMLKNSQALGVEGINPETGAGPMGPSEPSPEEAEATAKEASDKAADKSQEIKASKKNS